MWSARHGRPRYIGGLALTRLAAWLAVHRRQLLQRAEDDARGRRRCAEDETIRTTTAHSRRQVGATRRAGIFLAVSHAFLSSGVPERAPGGRGWPGLAGWMKAQIWAKTRIRGRDWADLRRLDEKNGCQGPRRAREWRCSYPSMRLLVNGNKSANEVCHIIQTPTRVSVAVQQLQQVNHL
jgi:hypothetical protein